MRNKQNNCRKHRQKASSKREFETDWQTSKLKKRNNKSASVSGYGKDVALTEHADAAYSGASSGRISKSVTSSVNKQLKQVESGSDFLAETVEEEIIENGYMRKYLLGEDQKTQRVKQVTSTGTSHDWARTQTRRIRDYWDDDEESD